MNVIDTWNAETFDGKLGDELDFYADSIRNYLQDETRYADELEDLANWLTPSIKTRAIRGWHYTRLTDDEVSYIRRNGIYPSSLNTIKGRLDALAKAGEISSSQADELFRSSPFHSQTDMRAGLFWLTSNPTAINSSGVKLLLGNWGGEGVYFWLEDAGLKALVSQIGNPRILEVAVPVIAMPKYHCAQAVWAVLRTFGNTQSRDICRGEFDFCSTEALGPGAVLAIHTEGDAHFSEVGNGYPVEYVPE